MNTRLVWIMIVIVLCAAACQSQGSATPETRRAPTFVNTSSRYLVSQTPNVFEPHIALDPAHPNSLAADVITQSELDCDINKTCQLQIELFTSNNGGETWKSVIPFVGASWSIDGMVAFAPDGSLYVTGLVYTPKGSRVAINQADANSDIDPNNWRIVSRDLADKPWLTVHPITGTLYVAYSFFTLDRMGISFARSMDGGLTFLPPVVVDQGIDRTVYKTDLGEGCAQVMVGNDDQLAVAWLKPQGSTDWPAGLWLANSTDGGITFSTPAQIGETWGVISTASYDNTYYIVYRRGTEQKQELALLTSIDNGATWSSTSISGARPLYFDWDKAPGFDVSPTGTLDIVFYAHGEGAPACVVGWAERSPTTRGALGWVDPCTYDVLYTFSKDGGKNFSSPSKLNDQLIRGERFTRAQGYSKPGEYIGMASATDYVYPIWIDTQGKEGTQAYIVQIKR